MKTFSEKWDKEERSNEMGVPIVGVGRVGIGPRGEIYKKWWFWVVVVGLLYLLYRLFKNT